MYKKRKKKERRGRGATGPISRFMEPKNVRSSHLILQINNVKKEEKLLVPNRNTSVIF